MAVTEARKGGDGREQRGWPVVPVLEQTAARALVCSGCALG